MVMQRCRVSCTTVRRCWLLNASALVYESTDTVGGWAGGAHLPKLGSRFWLYVPPSHSLEAVCGE